MTGEGSELFVEGEMIDCCGNQPTFDVSRYECCLYCQDYAVKP